MCIPTVEVSIRVKTQQTIISDNEAPDSFPLRRWKVEICMLNERGQEIEAAILSDCTFYLHPTFENPTRKVSRPPFELEEQGWGQFEIKIVCNFLENAGKVTIRHPLEFEDNAYAIDYSIKIPYHTTELRRILENHFTLQKEIAQVPTKSQTPTSGYWINSIPLLDQDAVNDIVQMIVSDPAVHAELLKYPRHEDFLMGLYQLPDDLLDKIRAYVEENSNG